MPRRLTIVVAVLGLGVIGGCGGGDDKKSDSEAAGAKDRYEKRLVAALRPTQGVGTVVSTVNSKSTPQAAAKVYDQISRIYLQVSTAMGTIKPPKDIAGVHDQIGAVFMRLSTDAGKVRDSFRANDKFARTVALADYATQAKRFETLAQELARKGYR